MADNWVGDVPAVRDVADATGETDIVLPRSATLRVGSGLSVTPTSKGILLETSAAAEAGDVPTSRTITAGAGLTGGGDLSANRTLAVVAADASIVVNADSIGVGVLQNDTMHGTRGGGTQHAAATTSTAGFMSAADKALFDAAVGGPSARVWHVGKAPGMYATVAAAVTAINALTGGDVPSATNRAMIYVWPGKYTTTSSVTIPEWTTVKGASRYLTQFQNDTTSIFTCSGHNSFEDFLIEGSTTAGLYAIEGNGASGIHLWNIQMLDNGATARGKFFRQTGSSWTIVIIERCRVDFNALSSYAILLENTSGSVRAVDCIINDFECDAYALTNFGGSIVVRACSDVRIRRSTIRGAAQYNTGVRIEVGTAASADVEFYQCDMKNASGTAGAVAIYAESGCNYTLDNSYAMAATKHASATSTIRNSST